MNHCRRLMPDKITDTHSTKHDAEPEQCQQLPEVLPAEKVSPGTTAETLSGIVLADFLRVCNQTVGPRGTLSKETGDTGKPDVSIVEADMLFHAGLAVKIQVSQGHNLDTVHSRIQFQSGAHCLGIRVFPVRMECPYRIFALAYAGYCSSELGAIAFCYWDDCEYLPEDGPGVLLILPLLGNNCQDCCKADERASDYDPPVDRQTKHVAWEDCYRERVIPIQKIPNMTHAIFCPVLKSNHLHLERRIPKESAN